MIVKSLAANTIMSIIFIMSNSSRPTLVSICEKNAGRLSQKLDAAELDSCKAPVKGRKVE
jgi:hypothetical protein